MAKQDEDKAPAPSMAETPGGAQVLLPLQSQSEPSSAPAPLVLSDEGKKRLRHRALRVIEASSAREEERQSLAYTPRDFVFFGLPYQPQKGASTFERRNGKLRLKVVADPQHGVPFGQDRLLVIWLATAFKAYGQPADGTIRFRAVRDILDAFAQPISGQSYAALKQRILRLSHTTFFVYDERDKSASTDRLRLRRYSIIQEVDLWFERGSSPNQHTLFNNFITLSSEFAQDLRSYEMPVDLESIKALKEHDMAMDLYLWQAHRCWELENAGRRQAVVPFFGEEGLLAQLGSATRDTRRARQLLRRNQKIVHAVWKGCPNRLLPGDKFLLRPAKAVHGAKLRLPGFEVPVRQLQPVDSTKAAAGAERVHVRRPQLPPEE